MSDNIPKFDLKTKILSNIEVAESHFRMELACPEIASIARPGQFIHLLIDQRHDPLLRRPFTIYRAKNGSIEILFQTIGLDDFSSKSITVDLMLEYSSEDQAANP